MAPMSSRDWLGDVPEGRHQAAVLESNGLGINNGHLGQPAGLVADLDPGRSLGGRVGHIAQNAIIRPGRIGRIDGSGHELDFRLIRAGRVG